MRDAIVTALKGNVNDTLNGGLKHSPSETSCLECVQNQWVDDVVHANNSSDGMDMKYREIIRCETSATPSKEDHHDRGYDEFHRRR
jgi:hypothetical protein